MAPAPAPAPKVQSNLQRIICAAEERYTCRSEFIREIATILHGGPGPSPVLIHGPRSTGKSSIVRYLLRHLDVHHSYVHCASISRPSAALDLILHQLKGGRRTRGEGYGAVGGSALHGSTTLSDFLELLPAAAASGASRKRSRENHGEEKQRPGARAGKGHPAFKSCDGLAPASRTRTALAPECSWVVLDHAHRLAPSNASGPDVLSALVRAPATCGARVGVMLLSPVPWGAGPFLTPGIPTPRIVSLPAYDADSLRSILLARFLRARAVQAGAKTHQAPEVFRQFLLMFVPAMARASSCLEDVETAATELFEEYSKPLAQGRRLTPAQLYARVRERVQETVSNRGAPWQPRRLKGPGADEEGILGPDAPLKANPPALLSDRSSELTATEGMELPFASKFLLLAAFVASRNKPTADRIIFDPGHSRRGRRGAGQASDAKAERAKDAVLKGPHSFTLERLLHVFYALFAAADGRAGLERAEAAAGAEGGEDEGYAPEVLDAEVGVQVSSLVTLRLLSRGGTDPLDPGASYRCHLQPDTAAGLARNLGIALNDFLHFA